MAIHVRNREVDALVRKLAAQRGVSLTEIVRSTVKAKLAQLDAEDAERQLGDGKT